MSHPTSMVGIMLNVFYMEISRHCSTSNIMDKQVYRNTGLEINSETCLERPHVRAVAQDRWSLFTGKISMSCNGAIEIIEFFIM